MSQEFNKGAVRACQLRVAAVTPFTSIDYPGKLSAVVFVRGCPWRCVYCHNPWMQARAPQPGDESWERVERLLARRQGLLDAVVFSGGEPCVDPALSCAIDAVKSRGMLVGLHTGGAYPRHLREIIDRLDWVGLDVKAVPGDEAHFQRVLQVASGSEAFLESYEIIRSSGVAFEARSTVHPALFSIEQVLETAKWLAEHGTQTFALQIYRKAPGLETGLDPVTGDWPGKKEEKELQSLFKNFILRRN